MDHVAVEPTIACYLGIAPVSSQYYAFETELWNCIIPVFNNTWLHQALIYWQNCGTQQHARECTTSHTFAWTCYPQSFFITSDVGLPLKEVISS